MYSVLSSSDVEPKALPEMTSEEFQGILSFLFTMSLQISF